MTKFYRKGDPTSSPFDPAMGDIVIYRDVKRAGAIRRYPAIVTAAHDNDRVDLTVFSDTGVRYVANVPYHGDDSMPNSYGWMPPKTPRKDIAINKVG